MKVTKEQLIEAFNAIAEKEDLNFNHEKDTLKLVLGNPKMTSNEFENVVSWLEHVTFTGHNKILITPNTSLNGEIRLIDVESNNTKLSVLDSRLEHSFIEEGGSCEIKTSRLSKVSLDGGPNLIKASVLQECAVRGSKIIRTTAVVSGPTPKLTISDSEIFNSILSINSGVISNRKMSSVAISAPNGSFDGRYFTVDFNGAGLFGYCNGQEKIIVVENKRYNLGSWEEQFVKKEQNQFVRMMNQKKLEMMNMFFDSLAFK